MSLISHRLALPYLAEAQAQKHVTINEGLRRLDALIHASVQSRTVSAEPSAPAEGDAYLLPQGKSGANWDGFPADALAIIQDGAWEIYPAVLGMVILVEDESALFVYTSSGWRSLNEPAGLGVNTGADSTNKLSVKSDSVLMSHDDVTPGSGDMRLTLNKASASDTASLVFQTGFSGQAEFGLTGSNDFAVKVADDQGTFRDAILIDRQTGAVSFPNTP